MMITRATRILSVVAFTLFLTLVFFIGGQKFAHAETGDIPTDPLPSACSDGLDNDGDGLADFVPIFGDPGCDDIFDASESGGSGGGGPDVPSVTECSDGIDNDGDGLIDFVPLVGDLGCDSISDTSEAGSGGGGGDGGGTTPACSDGIDNDGDGKVDTTDPGCADGSDTDETDPTSGGGDTGGGDTGGGNGGGAAAACEDSIDNDGDGIIDMADPGCDSAADNDESSGGSGGGGGGGSSGSAASTTEAALEPEILGTSTTTEEVAACESYLTAFIKFGGNNDAEQVMRLQKVLKDFEGASVDENGDFDSATLSAVHAFQSKYADEILTPWGIKQSTGFVYLTTRKKVNEIRCENKTTFPLTDEELKTIENTRSGIARNITAGMQPNPAPAVKKKAEEPKEKESAKKVSDTKNASSTTKGGTVQSSGLKKAWDFLGRLFNRGR